MTIIEDTGQKIGQHDNIAEYCKEHGITIRRQKLITGDYCLPPQWSIDTKKGMAEVYSDIVNDHERFRNECIRAQEDGTRLIILIEDEEIRNMEMAKSWKNPRQKKWEHDYAFISRAQEKGKMLNHKIPKPPVSSERLVGMMEAMTMKYGVIWSFCRPNETGREICTFLAKWR